MCSQGLQTRMIKVCSIHSGTVVETCGFYSNPCGNWNAAFSASVLYKVLYWWQLMKCWQLWTTFQGDDFSSCSLEIGQHRRFVLGLSNTLNTENCYVTEWSSADEKLPRKDDKRSHLTNLDIIATIPELSLSSFCSEHIAKLRVQSNKEHKRALVPTSVAQILGNSICWRSCRTCCAVYLGNCRIGYVCALALLNFQVLKTVALFRLKGIMLMKNTRSY